MKPLREKTKAELIEDQDKIREWKNKLSMRQFESLIEDWNLDQVFVSRFYQAILYNSSHAEIPLFCIRNKERRWIAEHGFEIEIDDKVGRVRL